MHLFCPSSSAWQSEGFVNLSGWLRTTQAKRENTIKEILVYAKRFGHILDNGGDASELLVLSPRNRLHAMTALAALAKYQGRYDKFQLIRQRYNLKWSSGNNSLQSLQRFFNPGLTLEGMLSKIREMCRVLPAHMCALIRFAVLTGLRPTEACESVKLVRSTTHQNYYNPEQQTLEHFRFPDIFLRTTKKAYVSYITKEQLSGIDQMQGKTPTWNAIRLACRHRNINMDMRYCRKVHGSWLHSHGVTAEEVDFLQGRVSPSVFSRHYLAPSHDLKDRVLEALESLNEQLQL
ncbi:MAG: hypothetical protein ICV68_15050 [Pyrinomonadaceae bacterium]|nr:hypothetical protein [Pyrinomonadaceae bacterium]